ncbi:hypothetical protein LSH36_286g03064 [Paralvinella palmiformis]|uniref:EF-hand domain-containing protein n=1 Tax=Paralvinella palmiformis TaxID=53620 RepID=A0AAD9N203_9ANNE|nr:hypothetical protein LSH36_286g03064 [Paralvinella palmiformis]
MKDSEADIEDFVTATFQIEDKTEDDEALQWQKALYKKIGSKKGDQNQQNSLDYAIERVMAMSKVLFGLHLVDHPQSSMESQWKKAISAQRKRAVMACFRMALLYNLPRHRAINLYLKSYREQWLDREKPGHGALIEDITGTAKEQSEETVKEEEDNLVPQPLSQLITCFSRAATTECIEKLESDNLYYCYSNIMSQSCHGEDDEEDEGDEEGDAGLSLQRVINPLTRAGDIKRASIDVVIRSKEMEKLKLLFEQARLADRGAAEMVIMYISTSKGNWSDMVIATIELGISILRGGNVSVQKRMLAHLQDKKDVGFFTSVAGLMQQCRVLDLDAFERYNKAEGLGVLEGSAQVKNLHDQEHTCKLFRFLQLLCEGHNLEFQNYLRTQAGNTTTVNVVICTVDYLLRLQESMMDFYWHYSGKDSIDAAGKESFFRAIKVASQVFNSITEYIQGPCQGNQLALAHSRLWDAVGGFLYIFAHMQDKLSKDPDQLELLREFMNLQKDMMIMLLSMLEGNVMNGPIGKQMVDTLVESSANVEMILKFFDIFLKMKDMATSDAFMSFDQNKDGFISYREFRTAMSNLKMFSPCVSCSGIEEIEYIMMCVDANQDGKVDFNEFTDRFHNPAKDIGFNVAVLLTNLSEHIPNDPRLGRFLEKARSVLDYFEPYLGRIEIMGGSGRIERVYFEIKQSHIDQWEKPQIKFYKVWYEQYILCEITALHVCMRESKRTFLHNIVNEEGEKGKLECFLNFCEDTIFEESKRAFLHDVVNEEGDKGKLEAFTNFCEDTIFEMQHATSISVEEQTLALAHYAVARQQGESDKKGIVELVKGGCIQVKDGISYCLSCMSPSNIREKYRIMKGMTWKELALGFCRLSYDIAITLLTFLFTVVWTFFKFIYVMMRGVDTQYEKMPLQVVEQLGTLPAISAVPEYSPPVSDEQPASGAIEAFGLDITKEQGEGGEVQYKVTPHVDNQQSSSEYSEDDTPLSETEEQQQEQQQQQDNNGAARPQTLPITTPSTNGKSELNGSIPASPDTAPVVNGSVLRDAEGETMEDFAPEEIPPKSVDFGKFILSTFARNFYKFKLSALALAFAINFVLLFYKVSKAQKELVEGITGGGDGGDDDGGGDDDDDDAMEFMHIAEDVNYLVPLLRILALLHTFTAFGIMVAYYLSKGVYNRPDIYKNKIIILKQININVPLVVFKREKEICRSLEFDGLWIAEQPSDDDIKGHWDKLAISTKSFPDKYWDKFVKKKVRNKYSEQYEYDQISNLLGMDKSNSLTITKEDTPSILPSFLSNLDWQYQLWKWGIIFTDNSFLYTAFYLTLSALGNYNYFFFAAHLLDVAICFKTLGTILQSVTHNGKQLVLTVMLLSIIVYVYTVIAFNFFRKFYVKEEDGEVDYKCHDMLTCYVFHLYVGVRAGGGIGDEIESPDGDPSEVYRILFDITFFFFVIIILLAIIQGLIIDAFGELRDQLEQVKEDLESSCFICGIGKEYFDKQPHGFEMHVKNEHNFANYMFFLMHLINKPDTEYTGQESYVWELYQQRCWDFFPVGDCFRKQYEDELTSS